MANSEVGGAARLGGLTAAAGRSDSMGKISPEQVAATVRPENVHFAHTTLLAVENSHNSAGGTVLSPGEMDALAAAAHERGLKVHVDGARIFNAAVALGVQPAVLARSADTLTFCLSKGLSAPVGSVLVGSEERDRRSAPLPQDGRRRHAPGRRAGRGGSDRPARRGGPPGRRPSPGAPAGRGAGAHSRA